MKKKYNWKPTEKQILATLEFYKKYYNYDNIRKSAICDSTNK